MPSPADQPAPSSSLSELAGAIRSTARLMAAADAPGAGAGTVGAALVDEVRALVAPAPAQVALLDAGDPSAPVLVAGDAAVLAPAAAALPEALATDARTTGFAAVKATGILATLGADPGRDPSYILAVVEPGADHDHGRDRLATLEALADAGAAALGRRAEADRRERVAAGHAALTRAAESLHASLDLDTVLHSITQEAGRILDGDYTALYRGTPEGAVIEAAAGMPPELIGFRITAGQGLSGKVLESGRSMLTNAYGSLGEPVDDPFFAPVQSCLAVPLRWGGELRGVLTIGYKRAFRVTEEHLALLEAFAELAAVACTNASAHAGLALVARTDGLTGCLNHAALHETLQREIERAERAVAPTLSLVMLDLDDFKSINEIHGHLVGDEVLRRAGHALRQATRPYDVAARYGGDEFALVAVEADEETAAEMARRTVDRIAEAISDLGAMPGGPATAGVAQWNAGVSATELIARADRALLFGKHEEGRGRVVLGSHLPEWFRPARFSRRPRPATPPGALPPAGADPFGPGARPAEQRLRDRVRRLAAAAALGTRLTATSDPRQVVEIAAHELAAILDAAQATVLRRGAQGGLEHEAGPALEDLELAQRCVAEARPILVAHASARSRIAVPLLVAGAPWGAVEVVARRAGDFGDDELTLAESVAAHASAALESALRHAELQRAYDEARAGRPPG